MIAFGPVPSRRLGRSLGVNNIPPKVCTYSCVYCQLGATREKTASRRAFYSPELIHREVSARVKQLKAGGQEVDFLTFVPDGEPTLDLNLGQAIDSLRPLGIQLAVITNASLIGREDVRADLCRADWVSLKVDSVRPETWRRINRPAEPLDLNSILEGMLEFANAFAGGLVSETMLVEGLNDRREELHALAEFLGRLKPEKAYLAIPTRPSSEEWVKPPDEAALNRACQLLSSIVPAVEYLIEEEGLDFSVTGDAEHDLLSIGAVHPLPQEAVIRILDRCGSDWSLIEKLLAQRLLVELHYQGKSFYMRSLTERLRS